VSILRALALLAAAGLTVVILAWPRTFGATLTGTAHGGLSIAMLGMSLCYVGGSGVRLDRRWQKLLFHPALGLVVLFAGVALALFG
jgi:predicted membrane protein